MRFAPLLLYLRLSATLAAFWTLGALLLSLFDSSRGPWQSRLTSAVAVGVGIGFGTGLMATSQALKSLEGTDWRQGDVSWFGRRQWTQVELPFGLLEALELVEAELRAQREFSEVKLDRARQVVTAKKRYAWQKGGGHVITVRLAPVGALGTATTRATVESRPWMRLALLEVGGDKANVESVSRYLNQAVNRRLEAERDAAEKAGLQAQLDRARLGLLQAQVEPHFLYNTLASLRVLIRDDPAAAAKMTDDLIAYLRLSVPQFREGEFTLGREIELVRAYLDIMKIRMGERLQVSIEVEEAAAARPFAPLLVHTLAENAIKHGLEPLAGLGRLSIEARCTPDGGLRVVVADNGVGLRAEGQGSGLGLANLRERLALLYGERARLSLSSNEPCGVVCVLDIPATAPRKA